MVKTLRDILVEAVAGKRFLAMSTDPHREDILGRTYTIQDIRVGNGGLISCRVKYENNPELGYVGLHWVLDDSIQIEDLACWEYKPCSKK